MAAAGIPRNGIPAHSVAGTITAVRPTAWPATRRRTGHGPGSGASAGRSRFGTAARVRRACGGRRGASRAGVRVEARERATRRCAPAAAAKEARYGFRPEGVEAGGVDRPRTLCFDCFRVEIDRRRRAAEQLARGWNASQVGLPLEDTLNELSLAPPPRADCRPPRAGHCRSEARS